MIKMPQKVPSPYKKRILFSILLPVLIVGVIICSITSQLITRPIIEYIQIQLDKELTHASLMALEICDNHFNYLMELRLENDQEMNKALKNEAVSEIKSLSNQFYAVQLLVADMDGAILGASESLEATNTRLSLLHKRIPGPQNSNFWGSPVRTHHRFFPFWRWFVVSYSHKDAFQAQMVFTKRLVYLGTFGVLAAIWISSLVVIRKFISSPLQHLTEATRKVGKGKFTLVRDWRNDEIGHVIETFNEMVKNLDKKNQEVNQLINALIESEKRYRELFDGAVEGILVVEISTNKIKYANPTICKFLGYSEDELIALSFFELFPEEKMDLITDKIGSLTKKNEKVMLSDTPCRCKDNSTIYVEIKATKVIIDNVNCILGFFNDVTMRREELAQRKELESRLNRSEKMEAIGLLAGGVAHDLNNILSGVINYPELILLDLPDDSPLRGSVKNIEKSGKRAAAIVQDLLTLARRGVSASQVVNLNSIVKEYINSPEHQKLQKYHPNVTIDVQLVEGLLDIHGSAVHLTKTVMNLISNAAEAADLNSGRILISTRNRYIDRPLRGYDEVQEGDYAVLTVVDDGVGIAQEDLKKIFEPFYTKKVMGRSGTGLGMAVVWGTVKDHNGYIDVTSQLNRGTTFNLYFPVTRESRIIEPKAYQISDLVGSGESILVVDDVADQREISTSLLSRLHYSVKSVHSGEAAIEYMKNNHPDLVILDMIMDPGIDGLETYKAILSFQPKQKVIIASGFSENDRVREALRLGVRQYIKKPYTLEQIGKAIKGELLS